jgi:hypothetical protein
MPAILSRWRAKLAIHARMRNLSEMNRACGLGQALASVALQALQAGQIELFMQRLRGKVSTFLGFLFDLLRYETLQFPFPSE